jgi:hypothetical protein
MVGARCAGASVGAPDRQRKGSFGDVERDVIVTFGRGAEHPRIATHRGLTRLLRAVTLDGEPADRLVDELHLGHGLVLAESPESAPSRPRPRHVTRGRMSVSAPLPSHGDRGDSGER